VFLDVGIQYHHLNHIDDRDIANAISHIGDRVDFRLKLFGWGVSKVGLKFKKNGHTWVCMYTTYC